MEFLKKNPETTNLDPRDPDSSSLIRVCYLNANGDIFQGFVRAYELFGSLRKPWMLPPGFVRFSSSSDFKHYMTLPMANIHFGWFEIDD